MKEDSVKYELHPLGEQAALASSEWFKMATTFMNTTEEVHAFFYGYVSAKEGYTRDAYIQTLPEHAQKEINREYHYFMLGRTIWPIHKFFLPFIKIALGIGGIIVRQVIKRKFGV